MSTERTLLEVVAVWRGTVVDAQHLGEGDRYLLGDGPGALPADVALPEARFPIATMYKGRPELWIPAGVEGEILTSGRVLPLSGPTVPHPTRADVAVLQLPPNTRARVHLGADLVLHFATVDMGPSPTRLGIRGLAKGDRGWRGLAAAATVHALVLLLAWATPVDAGRLSMDGFETDDRWVEIMHTPAPVARQDDPFSALNQPAEPVGDGTVNETTADAPTHRVARAPTRPKTAAARAAGRREARAAAEQVGAALEAELGAALNDDALTGAVAGLTLNEMFGDDRGTGSAFGGVGIASAGRGGPNTFGGPSVGIDGYRTVGGDKIGRPRGPRVDPGRQTRRPRGPTVIPQDPIFEGGLEKAQIRKVIRRYRAQYRACYEKSLQQHRDLSGKVVLRFTIGGDGRVIATKLLESTLADPAVERCMRRRILHWRFPAPKGGGLVMVRYPFIFKAH